MILALVGVLGLSNAVLAQDEKDHIFCCQFSMDRKNVYYTPVFMGDYGFTTGYENDFYDYLHANGWDPKRTNSYCFFGRTHGDAESELLQSIERNESNGYRVVRTRWAPETSTAPGTDQRSFTAKPLHDFQISVPRSPYDVQVCVRDHECEDGDRVRVSVNGSTLLSTEIVNEWICRRVSLREGRHDIELYAINGTGHKGACSYADANTGEIRVRGERSQTQSWRHRGGKGSSARIVVTVR